MTLRGYPVHGRSVMSVGASTILASAFALLLASACGRAEEIDGRPVTEWSRALYSSDSATRFRAASVLAHSAPTSAHAVGVLLSALKDDRLSSLHDTLAEAIATLGPRAAPVVPDLIVQSRDRHPDVRRNSVMALGHIGAAVPAVIPALADALSDSDHEVRIAAIDALNAIGAPAQSISPALVRAVTDRISYVRIGAINALDIVGTSNESAVPALLRALATTDRDTRAAVADALGRRLGPSFGARRSLASTAEGTLERLLRDEDPVVRSRAATALGGTGIVGHAALPALARARTDPDTDVRAAAHAALAQMNR